MSIKIILPIPFTDKTFDINFRTKANLPARASDPRYWVNEPQLFGHASNTFRNTAEQLKAYQGWVGDCVSLIANRMASLPLRLYDKNDELIKEHPFYDLMKFFNPDTTAFLGKVLRSTYKDLTGECYILMAKDGLGIPRELYFRSPDKMTPIVEKGTIAYYKYLEGFKEIIYPKEDILFFKYANPTDTFRGASPVQRKAYAVDTDKYNMVYQLNVFKNGAHLKSILETDKNMSKEQVDKFLDIFNATYGGAENAHKTGAAVGGLKFKTVGQTNKDMEFMLLAEWTMRQIASAYNTPPQKLSHPEQTNLANMQALDVSWNRECILPRCIMDAEVFTSFLLPLYKQPGLYCKYDNPVPADTEFILKKRESDLKNWVINVNEARSEDGKEDVPWGKLPLAPFGIGPLGSATEKPALAPAPGKAIILKKYTEEFKTGYWNQFIKRITPLENDFKRGMIKLFQEQELRVLRALRGKKISQVDVDNVLKITHDERSIKDLADFTIPRITEMVKINGTNAYAELGVEGSFDVTNPKVIKWIKAHCGDLIVSITDTTFDALKATLTEGIKLGESIPKLAARVTEQYADCKGYRAVRIARTETITASNQGALQAYKQSGVVEKKEWLLSADACDICLDQAAAGAIPVDDNFPGGFDAPTAHPNCKCAILPVIEKD